jgi:hypothetical protein
MNSVSRWALTTVLSLFLSSTCLGQERSYVVRCINGKCLNAFFQEENRASNLTFIRSATSDEINLLNVGFKFIQQSGINSGVFRYTITESCQKFFSDNLRRDPSGQQLSFEWLQRPVTPTRGIISPKDNDLLCQQYAERNSSVPVVAPMKNNKEERKVHCAFDVERISDSESYAEYFGIYFAAITPGLKSWLL